jgi:surfactin synthase thioesterase subunit
MFRGWPRTIGSAEVCPIQLPGRENRIAEPHFGTIEAVAEAACVGLEPFLDRPYAVFGHCAGALQAYEFAVRLAERRLPPPARIFLSSQPPPNGVAAPSGFNAMTDDQLRAELRRLLTAIRAVATDEVLDLYLSVYRPDLAAVRRYRQSRPVEVPLTVVRWTEGGLPSDLLAGWAAYGDVTFESLPGGHYDFLGAPPELLDLFLSWTQTMTTAHKTAATGGRSTR